MDSSVAAFAVGVLPFEFLSFPNFSFHQSSASFSLPPPLAKHLSLVCPVNLQFSHLGLFFSSFDLPFEAIIAESFDCSSSFFSASLMIALTSALRATGFPIVRVAALIAVSKERKVGVREV